MITDTYQNYFVPSRKFKVLNAMVILDKTYAIHSCSSDSNLVSDMAKNSTLTGRKTNNVSLSLTNEVNIDTIGET